MKRFFSLAVTIVLTVTASLAQVPVFLTAGQSNADGRELTENLPDYLRGYKFRYLRWTNVTSETATRSVEHEWSKRYSFCDVFCYWAEQALQSKFYMIKCAYGGTSIAPGVTAEKLPIWYADAEWLAANKAYRGNIAEGKSLAKALLEGFADLKAGELDKQKEGFDVKAIFWHQGESDRKAAGDYYENFKTLICHMRHSLAVTCNKPEYERIPFIFGTVCRQSKQYNAEVEAAQHRVAAELDNVHVIDMSTASLLPDELHFDKTSTEELGRRVYQKCLDLNLFSQKPQTPIMGWSSWNTYHVNISDSLIRRQAEALVAQGLKDAGYSYINIDDGFFGCRDEKGMMQPHPERFPNGMKAVADYIHSLGLKAGIYGEAGNNTCGSIYDDDANGVGAGMYGHEQQDMDLFLKDWGYDFIKIDYCGGRDLGLDEEERYRTICDAIKNTGRTDVSVNICRWAFPGTWARELARSWRISPDIRPRWSSLKNIIERNLYLSGFAGDGHFNDMDMLEIGRGMSASEDELHFAVWCLMSSPLLIGCDLTTLKSETLTLLTNKELIALNQDALGLQAYVVKRDGDCYILVKDIETMHGTHRAVALLNMSEEEHEFRVDFQQLELGGKVKLRDLARHKDIGTFDDSYSCKVGRHEVKVFRAEAEHRLDASRYEAEWAYLNQYEEVGRHKKPVLFADSVTCSGGKFVHNLGGSAGNYAEWRNVWSDNGGNYELQLYYLADKDRTLELTVNGETRKVQTPAAKGVATIALGITLQKGMNTIRMGNSYGWAPDIDKFELRPAIVQKAVWRDTDGNPINCHGMGMLEHKGVYYMYGEYKLGKSVARPGEKNPNAEMGGVSCYSSRDLMNWRFEGVILMPVPDDPEHDLHPSKVVERPKVIYNKRTRKFVMWAHVESRDYSKACAGVAVADKPTGPFRYLGSFRPNDSMSRDQTLFVDDDGTAYQFSSSEENKTLHINRLTPDYLKPDGTFVRRFVGLSREAPAVFKHDGRYYIITSGCTGWSPNKAEIAVADSIMGEWTTLGNPCIGPAAEKTFMGQSTYVQPLPNGRFLACFDMWKKNNLPDSRYIWLPIDMTGEMPTITWREAWHPE